MAEARLERTEGGWIEPRGDGWFVLNARDARWSHNEMGWYCNFEGAERFPEFGFNLNVLPPGKPMALYHHEPYQEGFLVLAGDALLIVEGEEHGLKEWDYVHCPRDVPHVILGAGETDTLVLAVGSRVGPDGGEYPVDETAIKHGAGRTDEATSPRDAYARFGPPVERSYPGGLLPDERTLDVARREATPAASPTRGPASSGRHIVNARDAQWYDAGTSGFYADLEQGESFAELGVNLGMCLAGQIGATYHRESHQECYFVLAGEGVLIVEGEERPLKRWDYFHCPAGVNHACVAAGHGPFVVIAVGGRMGENEIVYPVNETAARYGASVQRETNDPREAYASSPRAEPVRFREEFLAG